MQLVFCEHCEHWTLRLYAVPNKNTGVADKYCESCLPNEYKEALENYKKENPEEYPKG